jgi:hypothetical protein
MKYKIFESRKGNVITVEIENNTTLIFIISNFKEHKSSFFIYIIPFFLFHS